MGLINRKKSKTSGENAADHKKKATSAQAAKPEVPKNPSTQSWIPIRDIRNSLIYRKDNGIVSAIRVHPVNINLLSDKEKMRKVKRLEEGLNGIDYIYQILSIAKPVDLDAYILKLETLKAETDSILKKKLLSMYSRQAAAKATSGEALERHFYILIDYMLGKKPQLDEQVLLQRATTLASSMSSAELFSSVCTDNELRTLQFIFSNPAHSSFERAPVDDLFLPPVFYSDTSSFSEEVYA